MGRYGRSRSRSPPQASRLHPYDDVRDRSYRRHSSPAPTGLLVRNISLDVRPEDLRVPFERFGPVKDVYLPRNYYTREPREFGFVKYCNLEDAAEAKYQLNHTVIGGREISIVFAEENRKTPQEMRTTSRISSGHGGSHRRRNPPPRSPHGRYHSYSRSPSPRHDYRDREGRSHTVRRSPSRSISRSPSPRYEKHSRRSRSPREADQIPCERRGRKSDRKSSSARDDRRSLSPVNGNRSPSPRGNRQRPEEAHKGSDHISATRDYAPLVHANHPSQSPPLPVHGGRHKNWRFILEENGLPHFDQKLEATNP